MIRKMKCALLLLLAFCMLFTGCVQKTMPPDNGDNNQNDDIGQNITGDAENEKNDNSNQNTDDTENGGLSSSSACGSLGIGPFCEYKSEKIEFDINDVSLEFSYGGYYSVYVEDIRREIVSIPWFNLCFENNSGNRVVVRRVDEEFISEKYDCTVAYDEQHYIDDIEYNYSEYITIPEELFTNEKGKIIFSIRGESMRDGEIIREEDVIVSIPIFYEVVDGKVILSSRNFD